MRDLDFLKQKLTSVGPIGLDSTEPDFVTIMTLVEQKDYAASAVEIEKKFDDSCYDIRLIAYYLYAAFNAKGPIALCDITEVLEQGKSSNWDSIGPETRKEKYFNTSITWLFTRIVEELNYHETVASPLWTDWSSQLSLEVTSELKLKLPRLNDVFADPVYLSCGQSIGRISAILLKIHNKKMDLAKKAQEEASAQETDTTPESLERVEPDVSATDHKLSLTSNQVELEISPLFTQLCEKLSAFETVVASEEYEKAAIISDDIMAVIKDFDPRAYFPKLFTEFLTAQVKHVARISPHWEKRESVDWIIKNQLYKFDLAAFIKN